MMKTAIRVLAILLLLPTTSLAQTPAPDPVGSTCAKYSEMEFTSLTAPRDHEWMQSAGNLVINRPSSSDDGWSAVFERASGYLRSDASVGLRRYRRQSTLGADKRGRTAFGQVLVGASRGIDGLALKGSTGGTLIQPGVGVSYGSNHYAVQMQADYRYVPRGRVTEGGVTSRMSGLRVMAGVTWRLRPRGIAAGGLGCDLPSPPKRSVPSNPALEVAIAFNGPQYWTAEFPGIALTGAYNVVRSPRWGAAVVAEADASYVRASKSIGARVFVRTRSAASDRLGASAFAQYLVGTIDAGREGIVASTGGRLTQPGIGFTIGTARYAVVWQMDRQHVPGTIHDEMRGDTAPLSRTRTSIGFVRRFLNR